MIRCPACQSTTTVRETREIGTLVRRRRFCTSVACGQRWTTVEVLVESGRPISDVVVIRRRDLETIRELAIAALAVTPEPTEGLPP